MKELTKLVDFVTRSNWIILSLAAAAALAFTPVKVYLGVVLGGLIVAINFHLLKHTLKKSFQPEVVSEKGRSLVGNVLVKYYIRFGVSALVIFLLISNHVVHPLGLLAGLSVVVASMFLATLLVLTRLLIKEAV